MEWSLAIHVLATALLIIAKEIEKPENRMKP